MTTATPARRVLIVSPHFPPDNAAGAHRARVLAPYLAACGWQPTVLTLDRDAYEGELDEELAAMVNGRVPVIRARAASAARTRVLGIGDLGLRALRGLYAAACDELSARPYHALYLTTYPVYPALLGPRLARKYGIPFVLDLQDPWVGAWGETVGGGANGTPDWKSRVSRRLMASLERRVVPRTDALTSVSSALLGTLHATYPAIAGRPAIELPIGLDPCDVAWAEAHPRAHGYFDPRDGLVHICYVGTLLPLAAEVLRAFLGALADLQREAPDVAARLRVHFIGTSNQAADGMPARVMPVAQALGVANLVAEHPKRVPFADALRCLLSASVVLVLGSTEARYTASKIAPGLLARKPLLVVAHRESDAVRQAESARDPAIALVTFGEGQPAAACRAPLVERLSAWAAHLPVRTTGDEAIAPLTGPRLAARLATLLDEVSAA